MPEDNRENGIDVANYPLLIKGIRARMGLTQKALADRLGVSFATVNRWENGLTRPSQLSWNQLRQLEHGASEKPSPIERLIEKPPPLLDFTADPNAVKVLAEGERLSFGHLMNPAFATENALAPFASTDSDRDARGAAGKLAEGVWDALQPAFPHRQRDG